LVQDRPAAGRRGRVIRIAGVVLPAVLALSAAARDISSPDGNIAFSLNVRNLDDSTNCAVYEVRHQGASVIAPSRLAVDLEEGGLFRDNLEIASSEETDRDSKWQPVWGERSEVRDRHREAAFVLRERGGAGRCMRLTVRVYEEGAAYCYSFLERPVTVRRELNEFRLPADAPAWATYSAQGLYERVPVNGIRAGCERPLTIELGEQLVVAIGEARLVDFARMKLGPLPDAPHALVTQLEGPAALPAGSNSPWRIVMAAGSPARLMENNELFQNLNDPCALSDTSWIKPGKVIREVTFTTAGAKRCVDFAKRRKLQYVEFDAGWYGREEDEKADARAVALDPRRSAGPLDLPEVIGYAKERGIGVLLYVNQRALERQLDEILPLYRQWGVAGVKYGFVNVGSQRWTSWLHEAVRKAAEHRLMVDIHDEYRPTGYSRTYPNLMTQEGIRGDEEKDRSVSQTLVHLFTRCLAGPADNTFCYFNERVRRLSSHAAQLAKPVCIYSPWQFLYWYDRPPAPGEDVRDGLITDEPGLEFWDALPCSWVETRVLEARIGSLAAVARRSGEEWFVGILQEGPAREYRLACDFLPEGRGYVAVAYTDDPAQPGRTGVRVERKDIRRGSVLTIPLRAPGGAAIRFVPAEG
jgi:alpha-glucosidase